MGKIKIMGPKVGDESLEWDPENAESVEKAKATFTEKLSKGFKAFKVVTEAAKKKGDPITEFDPSLKEILLTPAMAGG